MPHRFQISIDSHALYITVVIKNRLAVFKTDQMPLNYIHQNPVRAGLVDRVTDYRSSSAHIWQGCQSIGEPLQVDNDLINWNRARQR